MILSFDSLCHVNKLGTLTLWGASSTGVDEESNPKIRIFVGGKDVRKDRVSRYNCSGWRKGGIYIPRGILFY
jgi:hypothetical protein